MTINCWTSEKCWQISKKCLYVKKRKKNMYCPDPCPRSNSYGTTVYYFFRFFENENNEKKILDWSLNTETWCQSKLALVNKMHDKVVKKSKNCIYERTLIQNFSIEMWSGLTISQLSNSSIFTYIHTYLLTYFWLQFDLMEWMHFYVRALFTTI